MESNPKVLEARIAAVHKAMREYPDLELKVMILSPGKGMKWLLGQECPQQEKFVPFLVIRVGIRGRPILLVPKSERRSIIHRPRGWPFSIHGWKDGGDPCRSIFNLLPKNFRGDIAVGGELPSRYLLELQANFPGVNWVNADVMTRSLQHLEELGEK